MTLADIPILVLAASAAPLVPVLMLVWRGSNHPALRWLLAGLLLSLVIDGIMLTLMLQGRNNHWLSYLLTPFFGAALLMGLAHWQRSETSRTALQVAAGLLLVAAALLTLLVEDRSSFSSYASPLRSLLVLVAALWTALQHLRDTLGLGFWRAGALWASLGLALYSGVSAAYFPLAAILAEMGPALVMPALQLKSALVVLAFLLVGWGVVAWTIPAHSGPSSSSWS